MGEVITLRGGAVTTDPRLDRLPQWDERNRMFMVRDALTAAELRKPRSYTWRVGVSLDQGNEGACVGFGWAHELAARPRIVRVNNEDARSIYHDAQRIDDWEGGSYPGADPFYEGTSVLAGAKIVQQRGHIGEYRWATTVDELAAAVGYEGPAVLGVNWWSGMDTPDSQGFIHPTGYIRGGHCILCFRVSVRLKLFALWNSWGDPTPLLVSFDDMAQLLAEFGEACIPMQRQKVAA